jgi:hypothetical protein
MGKVGFRSPWGQPSTQVASGQASGRHRNGARILDRLYKHPGRWPSEVTGSSLEHDVPRADRDREEPAGDAGIVFGCEPNCSFHLVRTG